MVEVLRIRYFGEVREMLVLDEFGLRTFMGLCWVSGRVVLAGRGGRRYRRLGLIFVGDGILGIALVV